MVDDIAFEPLTGGCNCGAVRYEVTAPLLGAAYCHCTRCQRRTGTASSASAWPAADSFRIIAGQELLKAWTPSDGWQKWFCGACGSAMFSRNPDDPEQIGIRMGTFDGDPRVRPRYRQFVASAAPWEPIPDDALPRYPDWAPELASRRTKA
jgi:hypothetical protein